jgi:NADPH2 dehydrogenase
MATAPYPKVAQLKSVAALRARLAELGCELPMDDGSISGAESPLAAPLTIAGRKIGNRWCIHPMEGWDANRDGSPSEHTLRRWRHFGLSGAKLIWGGEAAAVVPEGRANPHQTLATASNRAGLAQLLEECRTAHREHCGSTDDLLVGLQLTHSGRFCKPNDKKKFEPRIAHHHPLLDAKFGIDPHDESLMLTDDELERLIDAYVAAAKLSAELGYEFVDVKACHGYLLHEFLGARSRPGKFGGDLAGRSRLMRTIIGRIRNEIPHLMIGVRLSLFDFVPYATSREVGQPMDFSQVKADEAPFGASSTNPLEIDLREPLELLTMLAAEGVAMFNLSCGSPYYNPHIQRPAIFPPSDGYQPPEDPLVGVWRQIDAVRQVKHSLPNLVLVGTGYTYLQDYLPHVAQAVVRNGWVDSVGLGRMVLSYPELPADVLTGKWERKKVCRTFSDCTTAPRHGLVSGCYPLDDYYKQLPERAELAGVKDALRS